MEISKVRVSNLNSPAGNPAPNQFWITLEGVGHYFQSYSTLIAFMDFMGNVILDENAWDYSTTTGKYRNIFLGEKRAETEKKIKSGEYKLADLN